MAEPYLQCIIPSCGKSYDVASSVSQCGCGNLLDVKYDIRLSRSLVGMLRETFSRRRNHRGNIFDESGVWRFRELLSFYSEQFPGERFNEVLVSLDGLEGKTKPFHLTAVANYVGSNPQMFYLQFEGGNPTGSFKDNGMASAFTHAKMVGVKKVVCASTGNTSASMAAYAANELEMKAVVFIGDGKIAEGKLAQALEYGAKTVQIQGDFDDAFSNVLKLSRDPNSGLYVMNSVNPFRLEGQKTMMYRILDGLDWQVPDWIVVPGGNLGNSSAFGKAFVELLELGLIDRLPRIAIVNATGANTLYTLFNEKGLRWNHGNVDDSIIASHYAHLRGQGIKAHTKATAIEILFPVNLKKALRTLENLNGVVTQVTDEEMLEAKAVVGGNGHGCEPASAATVAGVKRLISEGIIGKDQTVVGILTGHQLKDPEATIAYHSGNNLFSNSPIKVENDLEKIMEAIN